MYRAEQHITGRGRISQVRLGKNEKAGDFSDRHAAEDETVGSESLSREDFLYLEVE